MMVINDKLGGLWKKAVVGYFKVLSHTYQVTNIKYFSHHSWLLHHDSNLGPLEYTI
jgi:hypothetical protein